MTTAPKVQSELKPCPFCGRPGEDSYSSDAPHGIGCSSGDCDASILPMNPDTWNTRPIESALAARCERLEAAAKKVLVIVDHPYSGTTIKECREIENILNSALALAALAPEPQQDEMEG